MTKSKNPFFQSRPAVTVFWGAVLFQILLVGFLFFKNVYIQSRFSAEYDNTEARNAFATSLCNQFPKCQKATVEYIFDNSKKPGHYAILINFQIKKGNDIQFKNVIRVLDSMTANHSWLYTDRFIEYQFVGHPEFTYRHGKV